MLGAQKVLVGTGRAGTTSDRARGRADRNMMREGGEVHRKPQETRLDVKEGSMDGMADSRDVLGAEDYRLHFRGRGARKQKAANARRVGPGSWCGAIGQPQ
jgi:hypothetical protein